MLTTMPVTTIPKDWTLPEASHLLVKRAEDGREAVLQFQTWGQQRDRGPHRVQNRRDGKDSSPPYGIDCASGRGSKTCTLCSLQRAEDLHADEEAVVEADPVADIAEDLVVGVDAAATFGVG
jgi:hypothetical protein